MKSDKSLQPSVKTHPPYLYPPGLYRQNLPTLINLLITGLVFTLVIYYFKDSTSEHYSILFFSSNLQLLVNLLSAWAMYRIARRLSLWQVLFSLLLVAARESKGSVNPSPDLPLSSSRRSTCWVRIGQGRGSWKSSRWWRAIRICWKFTSLTNTFRRRQQQENQQTSKPFWPLFYTNSWRPAVVLLADRHIIPIRHWDLCQWADQDGQHL